MSVVVTNSLRLNRLSDYYRFSWCLFVIISFYFWLCTGVYLFSVLWSVVISVFLFVFALVAGEGQGIYFVFRVASRWKGVILGCGSVNHCVIRKYGVPVVVLQLVSCGKKVPSWVRSV